MLYNLVQTKGADKMEICYCENKYFASHESFSMSGKTIMEAKKKVYDFLSIKGCPKTNFNGNCNGKVNKKYYIYR